ncbi:hypothetical protein BKA63DRAFT_2219 [Paraphoma chrysanthemicola]|nr:hypothetical protein BKA63DRAFT_2219 [Paraphoma chrysanthemicola]
MAPTPTTNSSFPFPTGKDFGGDEFSNNLFSDLAPLLTLFGEQVTKQFLSMSMGWADDVLLAMGPLGIMTVIVSTIRVGGIKVLKAFVGRARESKANAEREILSSTSEDVCELWSGREVVRELGNPEGMKDLILLEESVHINVIGNRNHRQPGALTEPTRVLDISTAVTAHILSKPDALPEEEVPAISNGAPNIALNVRSSTASSKELVVWAMIATLLQTSALVFPAITTYHLGWRKGGAAIARYGYPCFATGTMAVIVGMIFCGRVIEGSTTEHEFKLLSSQSLSGAQVMRLQKACTVSDQHFMSYAIFNSPADSSIRTSRRNRMSYSRMAATATLTAVVGFVIQFVGLRALHWSATVYQLGIMLMLTIVRSLVRRGLAVDPFFYPLLDGFELAWLSLYILRRDAERLGGLMYRHVPQNISHEPKAIQEDVQNSSLSERQRDSPVRYTDGQASGRSGCTSEKTMASSRKAPYFKIQWWPLSITFAGAKPTQRRDPDPDERMLASIVRWEPFTGYYTINRVQESMKDLINVDWCSEPAREILEIEYARLSRVFYSLADISYGSVEKSTTMTKGILRDFCDLRQLVPTTSQASDTAVVLCLAIERTMALLTKSKHVLWRPDQNPVESVQSYSGSRVTFNLSIVRGAYDSNVISCLHNLEISVDGKRPDPTALGGDIEEPLPIWTIDREIVCSILSLWLFSLELRRSAASKTCLASRKLKPMELGPDGADQLLNHLNVYFRIVGSVNEHTKERIWDSPSWKQLGRWLHDTPNRVPGFGKDHRPVQLTHDDRINPINTWVVWGSHLSKFCRAADHFGTKTKGASVERSESDLEDLAVRTRPETTIAEQCALELYSLFIESIASQIETLGGRTMELHAFGEENELDRWRNSLLESIANECVTAGLARDIREANTVIIPAFMKHDLLPKNLHKEIKWSRNKLGQAYGEVEGVIYTAPIPEQVLDPLYRDTEVY